MLVGDAPFAGSSVQAIVARVLSEVQQRFNQDRERTPPPCGSTRRRPPHVRLPEQSTDVRPPRYGMTTIAWRPPFSWGVFMGAESLKQLLLRFKDSDPMKGPHPPPLPRSPRWRGSPAPPNVPPARQIGPAEIGPRPRPPSHGAHGARAGRGHATARHAALAWVGDRGPSVSPRRLKFLSRVVGTDRAPGWRADARALSVGSRRRLPIRRETGRGSRRSKGCGVTIR